MFAALLSTSAMAQEIDGALDRLKVLIAEQGAAINWTGYEEDGEKVVLIGVTVGVEGDMVPIGNLTLTGISEVDVGYSIESIELPYYTVGDGTGSVIVNGVAMTGVILPNEGQQSAFGGFLFYETAALENVIVSADGSEVFTLNDLYVEVTEPDGDNPMEFTGSADSFTIDLSAIEDADEQMEVMKALGYEQLSGYFEMAGSWSPGDGRLTLAQYDLSIDQAGTLGFTFDLGGYTVAFIDALRQMQKNMAENPDQDSSAQGLAILGLMQQLSLHGAELAFADDGLTNKVLGFVAQQQGMRPADIANQAKAILPFVLAELNNPEFSAMVTSAVSAFLDDPKSIRIAAKPATPTPFALVMAGAMTAPMDLPKTLGVTVSAND